MSPARPWTAQYEPGTPASLPAVDGPFHSALEAAADTAPSFPALSFFGASVSYAELNALSDRVAAALVRDGTEPGDRVLVALPHCPYLVASCLGVLKAGAVVVPVSPRLDPTVLERIARSCQPRAAVVSPASAESISAALYFEDSKVIVARSSQSLPRLVRLIAAVSGSPSNRKARSVESTVPWNQWIKGTGHAPEIEPSPDAPAVLLGLHEADCSGRIFSHRHLVAGAAQIRAWLTDATVGEDTWLQLAPLWTGLGFVSGLGTAMVLRSRLMLLPRWEVKDVLDALQYVRPSYVVAGRRAAELIAASPRLATADLRRLRAWLTDEPIDTPTLRAYEESAGFSLCVGFGPKGAAGLATCNPVNGRRVAGSVGLPLPSVDVRLLGEDGVPVEAGASGRLAVSGPNVAEDGWLDTGRLARIDEAGFVYLIEDE
jgi:long-chain acyl-CoA synthetase